MQIKWPWFERKFDFSFPPEKMFDIIERLRGTPARANELVAGIDREQLTWREREGTWSIQENIGHLGDLQPLWLGRIDDMIAGRKFMREADLTNATTFSADHNEKEIAEIITEFASTRKRLVQCVESLEFEQYGLSSLHPRLQVPMRIVDLCLFVSDHDDYHLARIRYLKSRFHQNEP